MGPERLGGFRRGRRLLPHAAALVVALAAGMAGAASASAITVGGGGPCLGGTGTLTLTPSTVLLGQSVFASWTTSRPAGCGVASELSGPGVSAFGGVGGSVTFTPPSVGTSVYTVTVFYPAGHVNVAFGLVTVQASPPPPPSTSAAPTPPSTQPATPPPTSSAIPTPPPTSSPVPTPLPTSNPTPPPTSSAIPTAVGGTAIS